MLSLLDGSVIDTTNGPQWNKSPRGGGGYTGPLVLCSLRISPLSGHSCD